MTKVDLKKSSGFSMHYDGEQLIPLDMQFDSILSITVDHIRKQLLNQEINSPSEFYSKYLKLDHNKIFHNKDIKTNVYLIKPNIAGIEFVKTMAIALDNYPALLEVIHGGGIIILQEEGKVHDSDIVITKAVKGQKIIVPPHYVYSIVNTKQSPMVVAEIFSNSAKHYNVLDEMQGMAYYVIKKNAKQEIVQNPVYRHIRDYRKMNWNDIILEFKITLKTPLIKQIMRKYEKFDWLFEENSFKLPM